MSGPGAAAPPWPRRWTWIALALALALLVGQGVRMARGMVSWGDENAYLHLGYLAASGQVGLFDDDMRGQRMPLPFYVMGGSQLVFGRSLLAARLTSLALGVVVLALVGLLGGRAAGPSGAALAALFLATQGVVVGFLATAVYHALVAALLLGGLALALCVPGPAGRLSAMAVISLLFLTRGSLWPFIPIALVWLCVRARGWLERATLVAITTLVPAAFFLSDDRHLKILAYVPLLRRLAEPLGYRSVQPLIGHEGLGAREQVLGLLRLERMYEFWWLALAALALVWLAGRLRGRPAGRLGSEARIVALSLLVLVAVQLPPYGDRVRELAGLFPSFAPLLAVVLGAGYAGALGAPRGPRGARPLLVAVLGLALIAPIFVVRHPLLPTGADAGARPVDDLDRAAGRLATLVPAGAPVFLYGYSLPVYLAGREPYRRQIHDPNSLAVVEDRAAILRNGLWGREELERWLGAEAEYAVTMPTVLESFRRTRPALIARMEALLAERFTRVARVDDYRWWVCDVYRRRPGAGHNVLTVPPARPLH